jgi:hypothetical protein
MPSQHATHGRLARTHQSDKEKIVALAHARILAEPTPRNGKSRPHKPPKKDAGNCPRLSPPSGFNAN